MPEIKIDLPDPILSNLAEAAQQQHLPVSTYLSQLLTQILRLPDPLAWTQCMDSIAKREVQSAKENPITAPSRQPVPALLPLVSVNNSVTSPTNHLPDVLQHLVFSYYLFHWCKDPQNPTTSDIAEVETLLASTFFDLKEFPDFLVDIPQSHEG